MEHEAHTIKCGVVDKKTSGTKTYFQQSQAGTLDKVLTQVVLGALRIDTIHGSRSNPCKAPQQQLNGFACSS